LPGDVVMLFPVLKGVVVPARQAGRAKKEKNFLRISANLCNVKAEWAIIEI
jgi:hypothetical protein